LFGCVLGFTSQHPAIFNQTGATFSFAKVEIIFECSNYSPKEFLYWQELTEFDEVKQELENDSIRSFFPL